MGRSFSRLNARKAERQMIIWDCVYSLVASLRERPKKIFQASSNLRPGLLISSHGEERREEWMTLRNLGSRKKKNPPFPTCCSKIPATSSDKPRSLPLFKPFCDFRSASSVSRRRRRGTIFHQLETAIIPRNIVYKQRQKLFSHVKKKCHIA